MLEFPILITGATGQVGNALNLYLKEFFNKEYANQVFNLKSNLSDLIDLEKEIKEIKPKIVFHFGAVTNVDRCEESPETTIKINYHATKVIVDSLDKDSLLIFISTDHVFNGQEGLYKENDLIDPINNYGQQKVLSEHYIFSNLKKYYVIRANAIYSVPGDGVDTRERNFVNRIYSNLVKGEQCKVPSDEYVTPIYSRDLVKFLIYIIESNATYGVYHAAALQYLSRYKLALLVARHYKLNENLLIPVLSVCTGRRARRPVSGGLTNSKLKFMLSSLEDIFLNSSKYI